MNIDFRIFGAPHTFDLFEGDTREIPDFQKFDNGSSENAKLTIQRRPNGIVVYSYLRYNLISSTGRQNSFFGMSVLFKHEYFNDIRGLYDIFDAVYKHTVTRGKLITDNNIDHTQAQAKYCVKTFAEAKAEVEFIEKSVAQNIKNNSGSICPLDTSFAAHNTSVNISQREENDYILAALKQYTTVSISPQYPTRSEIAEQKRKQEEAERKKQEEEKQKIESLTLRLSKIEPGKLKKLREECRQKWQEFDQSYNAMETEIAQLEQAINSRQFQSVPHAKIEALQRIWAQKKNEVAQYGRIASRGEEKSPAEADTVWFKNNTTLIAAAAVALFVLIIVGVLMFTPNTSQPANNLDDGKYAAYIEIGDDFRAKGTFADIDEAIAIYQKARYLQVAHNATQQNIDAARKQAADTLIAQAKAIFEKGGATAGDKGTKQMDAYTAAIEKLQEIQSRRYGEIPKDIESDFKTKTIDYYLKEIEKTSDNTKKKEYAENIQKIAPNNKPAQTVIQGSGGKKTPAATITQSTKNGTSSTPTGNSPKKNEGNEEKPAPIQENSQGKEN
ncbi:MAG: DUF4670 domain-containing protein [Bacteroidales bacterium]|jgi:hypothetical protein|nr:DUF4670 domain-containing protein [Bacteroidales bacterium]